MTITSAYSERFREGLTFDDVLLEPAYSQVLPHEVDTTTRLTRGISLRIPLVSSAMDTVTEYRTAIAMANAGGLGIIHKNMSPQQQAEEVQRVKKAQSGIVVNPVTVSPDENLGRAVQVMREHGISGLPVVENNKPVGILTNRDIRFETRLELPIRELMTQELVTAREGLSLDDCKALLHQNRIEKLIVVNDAGELRGLITIRDIQQAKAHPNASTDENGRLLVGAAVGTGQDRQETNRCSR